MLRVLICQHKLHVISAVYEVWQVNSQSHQSCSMDLNYGTDYELLHLSELEAYFFVIAFEPTF